MFQPHNTIWSAKFNFSKPLPSRIFCATKIDEIDAVNSDTSVIPANIISTANIRPSGVSGEKSPYPTVVIVTIAHQKGLFPFDISPVSSHCNTIPPKIIVINSPIPT